MVKDANLRLHLCPFPSVQERTCTFLSAKVDMSNSLAVRVSITLCFKSQSEPRDSSLKAVATFGYLIKKQKIRQEYPTMLLSQALFSLRIFTL